MSLDIRQATEADIPAIAAIHVSGWQGAYGGLVDQDYLDALSVKERIVSWTEWFSSGENQLLMAYMGGKAVGFIDFGQLRTALAGTSKIRPLYSSEIYALYLLPEHFRQGVGTALMRAVVEKLKEAKHHSMCLWVLKNNKRGCAFYDKMGGQRIGKKMIEIGPTKAKEVCYGWREIEGILGL